LSTPLRVLIVDDQEDDAMLMLRELRRANYDPTYERVDTAEAMSAVLEKGGWELVLCDHGMPKFNSFSALKLLHEKGLDLPFIIVSGSIGEDMAVAAMKSGAHDFVLKGNLVRLGAAVERELREVEVRRAYKKAEEEERRLHQELEEAYRQLDRRVREITASIMFTDLEGSTELLRILGDEENQVLLQTHNTIIRQQVAKHGGLEVKTMGDGFMVVFYSIRRAAACAVDIQRSLYAFNQQNPDRLLKVRIGINVGETIKEEEDYFGSAVVLAARIMAQASGGQILVSDLVRKLVGDTSSFQYVDCGWRELKGFAEEEHLYEVDWRGPVARTDTHP
jgi:class 3 adenylate cyclase